MNRCWRCKGDALSEGLTYAIRCDECELLTIDQLYDELEAVREKLAATERRVIDLRGQRDHAIKTAEGFLELLKSQK